MKKLTFLKSLLLATLVFSIGIFEVSADTYSHTIAAKTWSAYGDQTLSGVVWTASATGGNYFGYDATKGQQFGSNGSPANQLNLSTTGINGTITSVKVSTSGASSVVATLSVSVGGTAFTSSGNTSVSISATNTTYEFTGTGSGQIVISWSQTSSKAGASSGVQNSNDLFDAFVDRLTETFASVEEVLTGGAEIAKEVIEELQENLEDARVKAHAKLVRAKIYGQTYYKEGKYYAKDKLSDAADWASDHPAVTSAVISALTTIALALINRKRR